MPPCLLQCRVLGERNGSEMNEGWAPEEETDLAIRFIQNHQAKENKTPFFLMMSWGPPHWPYREYPEEHRVYAPDAVDAPQNVPEQIEVFARQEIAYYYENITGLDAQLGRLMDWLEKNDLRKKTILCFSSDHGDHLSSHGYGKPKDTWLHHSKRASKATPYEESIHIPLIISHPNQADTVGKTISILFSSVDVMPTLLSLAGVDKPEGIQGLDL